MKTEDTVFSTSARSRLVTEQATNASDIRQSQRLRFLEYRAAKPALDTDGGLLSDIYDDYCDHLIVRDYNTREVVACTRVLHVEKAAMIGGFYSEAMFDLAGMLDSPGKKMELGHIHLHPDYAGEDAFGALWAGICRVAERHDVTQILANFRVDASDGGTRAGKMAERLLHWYPAAPHFTASPYRRAFAGGARLVEVVEIPVPIKRYLHRGGRLCGPAGYNPHLELADLLLVFERGGQRPRWLHAFGRISGESMTLAPA